MIRLNNITKTFNEKIVLNNINIEFNSNSLTVITGESGCGKTTLFNIINGYLKSDSGNIDYSEHKILYNMVDDMNINILSVLDNLKLVNNDLSKIDEILKDLDIEYIKKKRVSKLSKGEQVRVSIARALLSDFDTILFDEPTGNLDERTAKIVFELLKKYSEYKTIIVASHDRELAKNYADYLYLLTDGNITLINENNDYKDIPYEITSNNNYKSKTIYKYACKKAFRNPVLYILALILMILTLFSVFLVVSYKQVDKEETSNSIINVLDDDYYTINKDDSFKDYSTVKEYMEGKEIANKFDLYVVTAKSGKYSENPFINAAFYEEFKEVYDFPKSIDDYTLTSTSEDNNEKIYPIIINTQVRNFFITEYKVDYQIGDIFDYTYQTANNYEIKFEIVDILDVGYDCNSITDLFPVIVPEESYYYLVENIGIFDTTIKGGLVDLYGKEVVSYFDSSSTTIIPVSMFSNLISYEESKSIDEIGESCYYYYGSLPQNDNEILVSNYKMYYNLTGNDFNNLYSDDLNSLDELNSNLVEKKKAFWKKYNGVFPIQNLNAFTNSNESYNENIKIVGYIGYKKVVENDNGEADEVIYNIGDLTIVSDELYSKLKKDMVEDNRVIYNYYNKFYISKSEVLKQQSNIINSTILIDEENISLAYKQLINMTGFTNIILYLGLVVFVLSTLVILIYFNNSYKTMKHDFAVFLSYGKTKKDLVKILVLFTSIIILPTLLFIPIFVPIVNAISQAQIHSFGIEGAYMIFSYGIPVLAVFGVVILFILISLIPLLKFRKNDFMDVIKNE